MPPVRLLIAVDNARVFHTVFHRFVNTIQFMAFYNMKSAFAIVKGGFSYCSMSEIHSEVKRQASGFRLVEVAVADVCEADVV